jgi:mono/diheme cytochrome c family protein
MRSRGAATIRRASLILATVAAAVALAGCEKAMRDMYDQPKYRPLAASRLFADGRSARPLVPGTVARSAGTIAGASSGRLGDAPAPEATPLIYPPLARGAQADTPTDWHPKLDGIPQPVTAALLRRGQQRFDIFCAPCHSPLGDGDGMVARRGFPHPPSFHIPRLRDAPDAHFYDVITAGYGAMYSYAARIPPDDRWVIVAYVRALQLSQHVAARTLAAADRRKLGEMPR